MTRNHYHVMESIEGGYLPDSSLCIGSKRAALAMARNMADEASEVYAGPHEGTLCCVPPVSSSEGCGNVQTWDKGWLYTIGRGYRAARAIVEVVSVDPTICECNPSRGNCDCN